MTDFSVTCHAKLRWLERIESIDMAAMRVGAARVGLDPNNEHDLLRFILERTCIDGARAVLKANTLVTVLA
jgi:hypothetical protein